MLSDRSSRYATRRPVFRAHIPAITAGLLANSLEPKLPPAGTGLMSSLLTGTLSVPAAMNR